MNDGFLEVSTSETRESRHASIDLFFRDLADAHRERAFCLVLSGTGSNGAVGRHHPSPALRQPGR
ncbi:chemotaxis protein CheB [Pseudomonas sp. LB3P81]